MSTQKSDNLILKTVEEFCEKVVQPRVMEYERRGEFPDWLVDAMADVGLFGLLISDEYGGLGVSLAEYVGVMETLGRTWAVMPQLMNSHYTVATIINRFATTEQKAFYLPKLACAQMRGAISLTEASGGSDLRGIRTKATLDGNGDTYVLNGEKHFITNGERAKLHIILARELAMNGENNGLSLFLVDTSQGGVVSTNHTDTLGHRLVDNVSLRYENAILPRSARLGDKAGEGLKQVLGILEVGRVAMAGTALGVAFKALDIALEYAKTREAFGKPIIDHGLLRSELTKLICLLYSARATLSSAVADIERVDRGDIYAGIAKISATEAAMQITLGAMRVLGGYGYVEDYEIARLFREVPIYILTEGTNEIQNLIIGRQLANHRLSEILI